MTNRKQRTQIAAETIKLLERETYSVDGKRVCLSETLAVMRSGTVLYTPTELDALLNSLQPMPSSGSTSITVSNCTTLAAAKALIDQGYENPLCLNFASAKNPGGGFLSGSQAQEESLARASGLYSSLTLKMTYYTVHRSHSSSLYTNHMIYSPGVPVFRDNDDRLLSKPYSISIVTSAAVNAGAVRTNEPTNIPKIRPMMETRIRSVLAVARQNQHKSIVLGAWGCGVFRNDPSDVAHWFSTILLDDPRFMAAFDHVVFAILDLANGTPTFNAFQTQFAPR